MAEQTGAERRIVTTLFADLAGSTALSESLDPEELDSLLGRFFAAMETVITRHGGVVEKYIGDAIAAYFGAQRAFGDDAARAVRAGLAMQRRLDSLRRDEPASYAGLRMRIGIESGEVLVTPGRETERLATGASLSVAARIESAAEEGTVLVGERAAAQSGGAIVFGEARTMSAKGVSAPLEVRIALEEASSNRRTTPFVGRETALARLGEALAATGSAGGRIVTVAGSRGSGRSRIVGEARAHADSEVLWLEARGRHGVSAPGYALFVDLLRDWLDVDPDLPGSADVAHIAAALREYVTDERSTEVAPALSLLLDPASARLPGDVVGRQVFGAIRALVADVSSHRPVVIVADDLEAADDDSVRLLAHIAPLTRNGSLVIVAVLPTTRSGVLTAVVEEWRRAGLIDGEISLALLLPDEARRLVSSLLPDAPHDVVEAVVERGSGEPYLLEQLAAAVAAGGVRAVDSVPDTVRGAIQARLDTLEEGAKDRVRAAAVFSGDVTTEVLEALLGVPSDGELRMLVGTGLLTEGPAGSGSFRFTDPLVQDVAYGTVPKAMRARWHAAAAGWLEQHAADSHAALAFHYAGAGDANSARRALIRAGDEAGAIAADATALRHYRAALDGAGTDWEPVERSALERKIGEALLRLGSYDRARQHFERGLGMVGERYPDSAAEIRRRSATGLAAALAPVRRRLGDPVERELATERARLYARLGWVDYFSDGDRFFLDALRTVRFGSGAGEAAAFETSQGLMGIGLGLDVNGNGRLAARFHRRALATAEADPYAVGFAHLGACVHEHHVTGDWDAALGHARLGMAAFAGLGATHEWGSVAYLAAWILGGRGAFADAVDISTEMLATAQQTGDRHLAAWAMESVGRICLLAGDPKRAVSLLMHAARPLASVPDNMNWARAQAEAVQAQVMLGDLDAATDVLEATERFVDVHDVRGFYRSELTTARARLALAYTNGAGPAGAAVGAAAKAAEGDWEGRVEAYRLAADLAALRGQPAAAEKALDRAAEAARRIGSPLHEAVVVRDRLRLAGDRESLRSLGRFFDALGLAFDPSRGTHQPGVELGDAINGFVERAFADTGATDR